VQSESIHDQLSEIIVGEYFDEQWAKARSSIDTDASDSLTRSNSFLESVCRHYLEQRKIDLPKSKTIVELIAKVTEDFPKPGIEEDDITRKDILKLFGGVKSIITGVGSFRTHQGTAHGGNKKASHTDARLVNNMAGAAAIYILEKLKDHTLKRN
jgi:hypothetical protein